MRNVMRYRNISEIIFIMVKNNMTEIIDEIYRKKYVRWLK